MTTRLDSAATRFLPFNKDILAAQMASKAGLKGITVAPLPPRPRPRRRTCLAVSLTPAYPPAPATCRKPFMRQAIEEGFILNVLRNHTPDKMAFKPATEAEVER